MSEYVPLALAIIVQRWLTLLVALAVFAGGIAVIWQIFRPNGPPRLVATFGQRGQQVGQFVSPAGVAIDPDGNLLVADTGNSRIQRFDPEGKALGAWGQAGADLGRFSQPLRVAVSREGVIWVADTHNNRLQSFDSASHFLSEVGSLGQEPGQFSRPIGMAFDPDGCLWVADSGNHRIQKFSPDMKTVLAVIPPGTNSPGNLAGQFNTPWGVACDAYGTVYVADTENNRVQRFLKNGTHTGVIGGLIQFARPTEICVNHGGGLYIVDSGNHRVVETDWQGLFMNEWEGLNTPQQIVQAGDGSLYLADTGNHCLRKYRPRGLSPGFRQSPHLPTRPRATPKATWSTTPSTTPTAEPTSASF